MTLTKDLSEYLIDELIYIREQVRLEKNYELSDKIRNYLDDNSTFVFDTPTGQEVYHYPNRTRQEIVEEINKNSRADRVFNSWLYSINCSINKDN
jgi:hypothetical protein